MKHTFYTLTKKATFLFLFLCLNNIGNAQIFLAAPANAAAGNPDAIVAVNGTVSGGTFIAKTPEACVEGDNINFSGYGEDPEWRFDIAIPSGSGPIVPSCSNIEIRVCRRGDFGQVSEATFVYDENFNQIGLIPGHPSNSVAFDCTDEPICTIITLDPCAFNEQANDGNWSVTLYTNGSISGNSVGDFCSPAAGPQPDGDAASCLGDCATHTQAVGGIFDNQAGGGPMVNSNCTGCNCAFIDYIIMDIAISDTVFTMSTTQQKVGESITLFPAPGLTCPQDWTVDGGTTGLASTSGTTTYTANAVGTYTICNNVGLAICQEQNCKTVTFVQEICDNGIDDDFDGLIDCNDPDCGSSTSCEVCYDEENAVEYKINSVAGATTYTWTVPTGAVISSQPADTFIIVDFTNATAGLDSIKVVASDAICNKDSISYYQNLIFCNDPPIAVNDTTTTNENTSVGIFVINNDSDPDNSIDISSITNTGLPQPSNGTVALNTTTGEITYTPNSGYNGSDQFDYTICDDLGLCDTATVFVTIDPVNDPPLAVDDIATVDEDDTVTFNVVGNDGDPNDPLGNIDNNTLTILNNPSNGTASSDPITGEITYTPDPDFWGMDTLTYIICDDGNPLPPLCDTAQVVITINSVDDFPFANSMSATTDEDVATTINVTSNDDFGGDGPSTGTISLTSLPPNGTATVDDNGTPNDPTDDQILYTPNLNYNGTDNFIYQICDSDNDCDTAIVDITINPLPDPPVANTDFEITDEDVAVTISASSNDTDIDNNLDPTTANFACPICTTPSNGIISNNTNGTFTYTPNMDYNGNDSFIYQICDASGLCDTTIAYITITPQPDPPVAIDDVNGTLEDVSVTTSVLTNDSDVDGNIDPSTVTVLTNPNNGTTIVNSATGEIVYQPNGDYNGTDQFEYIVCDTDGLCDTAMVDITIAPSPDPPIAVDDADVTNEDTPVTTNVIANDSDPDNDLDPASVVALTTPLNGTTSVDPVTGEITYTPNPDFHGTDSYTYQVCDLTTPIPNCDIATVDITVVPVNDPPVAVNDSDVTNEETPIIIDVANNDSDPTDPTGSIDPSSAMIISNPTNGTTSVDPVTGEVTYTPNLDFNGNDIFEYQICDNEGLCDTAQVAVDVLPVNDPPVAVDDLNFTNEETTVSTTVAGNDIDVDGNLDPLAVSLISNPLNGVANINPSTGQIIYTPSPNYNGLDSMEYSICDTDGLCDTATLVIEIFPVIDGVIASDDSDVTTEETSTITMVLQNDNDPDNDIDTSSVTVVTAPANGATSVDPMTGNITYTPDPNFNGTDSYSYEVCDLATPTPNCDIANVFITVDPINNQPTAMDDNFTTSEGTPIAMSVTSNDDDPLDPLGNIDPTTVTILSSPTNGTATVNSVTGEINYNPNPGYNGSDVLTYVVCDDGNPLASLCDTATVNITIDPVNNAPMAIDDATTTDEETPVTIDVAANDNDPNDPLGNIDPSTVSIISPTGNGTTTVDPVTGEITYAPDPDFYGNDVLEYVICDDGNPLPAQCDTAQVVFTVNPTNDTPIANNDFTNTNEDTPITFNVTGNDNDPNDPLGNIDPSTVSISQNPTNGTVSVDPISGEITYTPNPDFNGTDSLVYEVCDDGNPLPPLCNTATLYITVDEVNDPPVAIDDMETTPEDTPVDILVANNDSDSDGTIDPSSVAIITPSGNGTTAIDPITGDITFTPDPDFNGTTTFEYQVCDNDGLCDTALVTIDVTPTNDPPVAIDDANITNEEVSVSTNVVSNDSDIDGNLDPSTLTILTNANNGNAIVAGGEINYVPNTNFNGTDSVEYSICDTDGLCDTAFLIIDILPISDLVVAQNDNNTTTEETPVVTSVLLNDTDADNDIDTSSVAILTPPINGTTSIDPLTGEITYTPNPNFNGTDSYVYKVCDLTTPIPNCDDATVFITVDPVNDPPTANNAVVAIPEETTFVVDISTITNDNNDPLGNIDPSTMSVIDNPTNGIFTVDPITGDLTYTPNPNFNGLDTITYTICDDGNPLPALCDTAEIVFDVAPINNQPVATDDNTTTDEDTPTTVNVLLNDNDPNDPLGNIDPSTVSISQNPTNGTVSIDPITGEITYTPNPGFNGNDLLEYVVCDDGNPLPPSCDTATLNIVVNDINDAPIAIDDSETTPEDTPVLILVSNNDSDSDGTLDPLSLAIISPSGNGTTAIDPLTGNITFTPDSDFNGTTTFEYQICDDDGACDTALVTIDVTPTNDPPVAIDDVNTTNEEVTVITTVVSNDTDVDGNLDPSTTTILTGPTNGISNVDPSNGTIIYTPNSNYNGLDSVEYSICDTDGLCDTATLAITINSVFDAVVASDNFDTGNEDNPLTTNVLANDIDPDNDIDTSSVTVVSPPSNGTTSVDLVTGEITYTPDPDFNGTDSYSYQVCDLATPTPNCDIATVFVTVDPENDQPFAIDDAANTPEDSPLVINVLANDADPTDPLGNIDPTTVSISQNPTNGSVSIDPITGEITYTPNAEFNGNDTITYIVCDDGNPLPALCDTAQVVITVDPVNDAPIANSDSGITNEETPVTVDVAMNDADPTDPSSNIDPTSVEILENPNNGTTSVDPITGEITYIPNPDFNGNDTLQYVICDDGNPLPAACDTAEVTFVVNPINDQPIANDDNVTVDENTTTTVNVVANDEDSNDPAGNVDPTTVSILQNPNNGSASTDSVTGEITYTPNPNFNGTDSLQYTVCDDGNPLPALCDTATIYFTVDPINNPPVAIDDAATTPEDVSVMIDILSNDDDVNDPIGIIDSSTVSILQNPNNGSTFVNPTTGILTYDPNPDFNGNDTLTYIVCDDGNPLPAMCDTAQVIITIDPVNDNPITTDDSTTTPEDTPVTVNETTNDDDPSDPNGNIDPSSVSVVTPPTNGTTAVDPVTGEITYTPNPDFNGNDTLFYLVCDDGNPLPATCDTGMLVITIDDVNDAPVAIDDTANTNEDTPVVINVPGNDTDSDGTIDPSTVAIISPSGNGTTSVDPITGEITFTPDPNFNGTTSFEYQICDNDGACDTAAVVVNIAPINDAPIANNDITVTNEDTSVGVVVVTNDADVDGNLDITSIDTLTNPNNGYTVLNPASGEIIYVPNADFNGIDSFQYTICDLEGLCDTATVEITVTSVTDPVVVQDDNSTTDEDTPVVTNVLSNDIDPDNDIDTTSIVILTPPTNGTTSIDSITGEITYTPDPDFYGNDSYIYQVCDLTTPIPNCDDATVFITVDPINDTPNVTDDLVAATEDTPLVIDVLANDSDPNDPLGNIDPTTVSISQNPTNGTVSVDPVTGEVTYTPDPNFNGIDEFIYIVCDDGYPLPIVCDTATVTINVAPENDAPVAVDDYNVTNEDVSVTTLVADNDTDSEGNLDPTSVTVVTPSSNGTPTVNPVNGAIIYTPDTNFNGTDSITYAICDLGGLCDTAILVIDVLPIVDPVLVVDDNGTVNEDNALTTNVLANDIDPDNDIDTSSVTVITQPTNGTTSVDPTTGEITYTPDPDFNGTDSYSYQVCDLTTPTPNCDIATVFVTVDPVNDQPVAVDDIFTATEDTPITVDPATNDSDPTDPSGNIDPSTINILTPSVNGSSSIDPVTGEIIYTPNPNFNGTDSLVYEICDDGNPLPALCDTAIVYFDVLPSNDPPVAMDDVATVDEDNPVVIDVLGNDTDPTDPSSNIDPTSVDIFQNPTNGTVSIDPVTGELTYIPNPDFNGNDTITYIVCDLGNPLPPACDTAQVVVTVNPVNDNPVAVDDVANTNEDSPTTIDVATNDSDPSDPSGGVDPTSVNIVSPPTNGTTSVDPVTGEITYTPNPNFNGTDSLIYEICDTGNPLPPTCDSATVVINVGMVNDNPIANNDAGTTLEEMPIAIDVISNDIDIDGTIDSTSVVVLTNPSNGTTSVDPTTGEITYTPDVDFNGTNTFAYQVCDNLGACDTATVTIDVTPVNDPPVTIDDATITAEETTVTANVTGNDFDVDGNLDISTLNIITPPNNGLTLVNTSTGDITYAPTANFNGLDSLEYAVCDTDGLCDTATLVIDVLAIADAIIANDDGSTTDEDNPVVTNVLSNDVDPDNDIDTAGIVINNQPLNGTVSVDPTTGEITYTPNPDFNGTDIYTYEVCDQAIPTPHCDEATVTITVNPVNDSPIANDEVTAMDEDKTLAIDVLTNDSDPSDLNGNIDPSTLSILDTPNNGTTSIDPTNGEIIFTPNSDFNGVDSFTYVICDDGNPLPALCDTATVVVNINPINDDPIAIDDAANTDEDTPIAVNVANNDDDNNDPNGGIDPSTISILTPSVNGSSSIDPITGEITYTPNPNFNGTDSLEYIICDTGNPLPSLCDTALVVFTVNDINDLPIVEDDTTTTLEDVPTVINVLGNDTDLDGTLDPSSVVVTSFPANGTTMVDPITGEITYTPNPDFNGTDVFTYQVCDDDGACETATVTVNVTPVNDPPVAVDDSNITFEENPIITEVVNNDTDVDGNIDPTTVTVLDNPNNGSTLINPVTGDITYIPNINFNGFDTFTYVLCDAGGLCDTALVEITVLPVPDDLDANNDFAITDEDTPVTTSVLANDLDPDFDIDTSSVAIDNPPLNGTVSVDPTNGDIIYTSDPNFYGTDSYTYEVCDMNSPTPNCDIATVTITVNPINDTLVTALDLATTNEDTPTTIDVLANDSDSNDPTGNLNPATVSVNTAPTNGTTTTDPITGQITYIPNANFHGVDTLTYTVCDDGFPLPATCGLDTVIITVLPQNDSLIATDDFVTLNEDDFVTVNITTNDIDPNDPFGNVDPTSVSILENPTHGTVTVDPVTGDITYVPNPDFNGNDSLTYIVCDDGNPLPATCDTATVVFEVLSVNDTPIFVDGSGSPIDSIVITLLEDGSDTTCVSFEDIDLLTGNDTATCSIIGYPTNGTVTLVNDSCIVYIPNPDFFGTDIITKIVCDDAGACDTISIIYEITPVNDAPVAVNDFNSTLEDVTVPTLVLLNDFDIDGNLDPNSITIVDDASNGTTFVNLTTGQVIYTPNANYNGLDTIAYSICDTGGLCDTATIEILILPVEDPVDAQDDFETVDEDDSVVTSVLENDVDPDFNIDTSSIVVVTAPSNGTTSVDPLTGEITYTPNPDFNGTDSYSYQVCDLAMLDPNCDIATVFITVNPTNDSPVAIDDTPTGIEDSTLVINVIGNDIDPSDPTGGIDPTSVTIITDPTNGTVTVDTLTGDVIYIPNPDFNGTDTLTYSICDTGTPLPSLCDTATVIITVDPTNDAPIAVDDFETLPEDSTITVNVTTNDSDPNDPDGGIDSTSVNIVMNPNNGTATVDPITGEVTYIPNPNFHGVDTLTYEICDLGNPLPALCDTAMVVFNVTPTNDAPIAIDDTPTGVEDSTLVINVIGNDIDPSDPTGGVDPTSVTIITDPTNGTVTVDTLTGDVIYIPNPDFNGTDTLTYSICDTGTPLPSLCDTAIVIITVDPTNDAPIAIDDFENLPEDSTITINVTVNDSDSLDPDGGIDSTSVNIVMNPNNGTATVDPISGEVTYVPNPNFHGVDTLTYEVCDLGNPLPALCDTAMVIFNVGFVNDVPTFVDGFGNDMDTLIVPSTEDLPDTTCLTVADIDIFTNNDALTCTIISQTNNGLATVLNDTCIVYQPNSNFNGLDTLVKVVCDMYGGCDTLVMIYEVTPVNDSPVAVADTTEVHEDGTIDIAVTTNDGDPNDPNGNIDPTSVDIVINPTNGTTSADSLTGVITYIPNPDYFGLDSFTYVVCDDGNPLPALCDTATVIVNVLPDTDEDGIVDIIDLDDDNDGIPDLVENGGVDPHGDDDGDGIYNYLDPDCSICSYDSTDDNGDGIPDVFDFDNDGVPNSYDLDSDKDGIADVIEMGGTDANGDGMSDGFADLNNNGLADEFETVMGGMPLPILNTDNDPNPNYLDIDSDNDGIVDNIESQPSVGYVPPSGNDANGNGWDDMYDGTIGGTPVPVTNTDETDAPDYVDTDSDNDGIPDSVEGNDANQDGIADTVPSGFDTDNDGLDDAFDTMLGVNPTNSVASNAPIQDTDSDTQPDYRDIDSDNDGISDNDECPAGQNCPDIDGDGIPDYLDLICNGFLNQPLITVTTPVCITDSISMFVQNEYLTNILQMDTTDLHFIWLNGNGDTLAVQQDDIFTIAANDPMAISPFSAQVTVEGCISPLSAPTVVDIIEIPEVTATNSGAICQGDAVQLSSEFFQNATYEWRVLGTNDVISTEREFSLNNVNTSTTFEVTVYIAPCTMPGIATTTVEVETLPTVAPMASYTLNSDCSPADLTLMSNVNLGSDSTLTYEWVGPNGFISNEKNPIIVNVDDSFNGSYTLTVTSTLGCSVSGNINVNNIVNAPAQPTIVANGIGSCEGEDITLSIPQYIGSSVNYTWFRNGTLVNSGSNILTIPNATFANAGIYTVSVVVDGCTLTAPLFELQIATTPIIVVAQPDIVWCANGTEEILLDATTTGGQAPYSYLWNGPNNFLSVNEDPVLNNVTFTTSGSYTVWVIDANGCQDSISVEVDVIDAPATPIITSSGQTCVGETVTIAVQEYVGSLLNYEWTTPNGITTNIVGLNSNGLIISPVDISHEGNYVVTVTIDSCTTVSDTFNLTLLEQPIAAPTYNINGDCLNGSLEFFANANDIFGNVTYLWTGPNGFTSNAPNPVLNNAPASANGDHTLTITNGNGCQTSESIIVTGLSSPLEQPIILANGPVCESEIIHFSLQQTYPSNATISWFNATGNLVGTGTTLNLPANDVNAISPYTSQVDFNGCVSDLSNQVEVEVFSMINLVASNNGLTCPGEAIQLFANDIPNATYEWTIVGTTTIVSNEQDPIILAPDMNTTYQVEITTDYNCVINTIATTTVEVLPQPMITNLTGGGIYCEGNDVTLSALVSESGTYTWTGPNGFFQTGSTGASSPYSTSIDLFGNIADGTYSLVVVSDAGCTSALETVQVNFIPSPDVPELTITNTAICEGDMLQLNSTPYSGINVQYEWYFTNNIGTALIETTNSPTHIIPNTTPTNSGQYSVKVVVDGCLSPISNVVFVEIFGSTSIIEASNNSTFTDPLCEGDYIQLSLPFMTNATYQWFGPAGFTSDLLNPVIDNITTANAGDYFAIVTLNGCAVIETEITTVFINPIPDAPSIVNNSPVCEGSDVTLTVSSSLIVPTDSSMTFTWYEVGTNQLMGMTYEPFFVINSATTSNNSEYYLVKSVNGCEANPTDATPVEVNIISANEADAGQDIEICAGSVTYLNAEIPTVGSGFWTTTTGATIANPELPNTEVFDLVLGENIFIWTLSNGVCADYDVDTVLVTVTEQSTDIANAGLDFEICNISNVNLSATIPSTALGTWTQTPTQASQGIVIVDPTNSNTTITGMENGNSYTFTWTLSQGNCVDFSSDEVVITTYDVPVENAFITMPEFIYLCDAEDLNLEAIAPTIATGLWTVNTNALIVNAELNNTIAADLEVGENIFVWSLSNGVCDNYSTDTIYVYVDELLEANDEHYDIIFNDSLLSADLLENDITENVQEWSFNIVNYPNFGDFDFDENGIISYTPITNYFGADTLIYELCNTNCSTQCDTAMVTFQITGVSASGECFIPNVMTPNDNGVNDAFMVPCLETFDNSNIKIFNRWGDEVYQAAPYNNDWKGTHNGKPLPAGTYFYILDLEINGNVEKIQGYLTIFR